MRFETEKREVRRFRRKRLEYWKPQTGEYSIILDLKSEPKIREQKFERGVKRFADFQIETVENGELVRKLWSIPIARAERVNGELVIYFWEKSQRGTQIMEIAEKFGYQTHIVYVKVQRGENPLNTQYLIRHSDNCPCLERKSESKEETDRVVIETEKGKIEYERHDLRDQTEKTEEKTEKIDVIKILRERVKEIGG